MIVLPPSSVASMSLIGAFLLLSLFIIFYPMKQDLLDGREPPETSGVLASQYGINHVKSLKRKV